jgi:outer membrane protein assembly factor BamB
VIADGIVVTYGVTSELRALELKTGKLLWKHDLRAEMHVPQDFFGAGGTPLIIDGRVIVNVGGKKAAIEDSEGLRDRKERLAEPGVSVAAFDLKSGEVIWKVEDAWGASYASPIPAKLHGQLKVVVYAGGESDPATGGLMCIDPASGKLHSKFAWRDDEYIQAIGTSPVVIPEKNRAFITTAYPKGRPLGGAMVEYDADFQPKEVWKSTKLAVHWMNPVYHDGHVYGLHGRQESGMTLRCISVADGKVAWEASDRLQGGTLIVVGDKLLLHTESGELWIIQASPEKLQLLRSSQITRAGHRSHAAFSNGLLYARDAEKMVVVKVK